MANQYYYLISGLPDLAFEDSKKSLSLDEFHHELKSNVDSHDYEFVKIIFYKYDNLNVINALLKKEQGHNPKGIFSSEEIEDEIKRIKDEGVILNSKFPEYLQIFIDDFVNDRINSSEI